MEGKGRKRTEKTKPIKKGVVLRGKGRNARGIQGFSHER